MEIGKQITTIPSVFYNLITWKCYETVHDKSSGEIRRDVKINVITFPDNFTTIFDENYEKLTILKLWS